MENCQHAALLIRAYGKTAIVFYLRCEIRQIKAVVLRVKIPRNATLFIDDLLGMNNPI